MADSRPHSSGSGPASALVSSGPPEPRAGEPVQGGPPAPAGTRSTGRSPRGGSSPRRPAPQWLEPTAATGQLLSQGPPGAEPATGQTLSPSDGPWPRLTQAGALGSQRHEATGGGSEQRGGRKQTQGPLTDPHPQGWQVVTGGGPAHPGWALGLRVCARPALTAPLCTWVLPLQGLSGSLSRKSPEGWRVPAGSRVRPPFSRAQAPGANGPLLLTRPPPPPTPPPALPLRTHFPLARWAAASGLPGPDSEPGTGAAGQGQRLSHQLPAPRPHAA